MRTKLGLALDIFILVIGPWIIYTRIVDIMDNGIAVYPVISILIVTVAVVLAVYNLYMLFSGKQQDNHKR